MIANAEKANHDRTCYYENGPDFDVAPHGIASNKLNASDQDPSLNNPMIERINLRTLENFRRKQDK